MKKKVKIIVIVLTLICVSLLHIFLIKNNNNKISEIEKIKLQEITDKVTNNISLIDKKSLDNYIIYSLYYSYENNNEISLSPKEITNIINSIFSINVSEEQIINTGITPDMVDNNIIYNQEENIYKLNIKDRTYSDIAITPIYYYEIKDITHNKDKYIVTYYEYLFDDIYSILNYYEEQNNNHDNKIDTNSLINYLKGEEKVSNIKKYFTKEIISKYNKSNKQLKITYIIKDNNILIESISTR